MSKSITVKHGNKQYFIPDVEIAVKLGAILELYPDDIFKPGSVFYKTNKKTLEVHKEFCIVQALDVGKKIYSMVCIERGFLMMKTFHEFNLFTMDEIKEYIIKNKLQHKGFVKDVIVEH